jgi:hypothetical protein
MLEINGEKIIPRTQGERIQVEQTKMLIEINEGIKKLCELLSKSAKISSDVQEQHEAPVKEFVAKKPRTRKSKVEQTE